MSSTEALRLRALARAIEVSGGLRELAAHLGMRPSQLSFMLHGITPVPEHVFLRLVDLLISRALTEIGVNSKIARKGT